MPAALQPLLSHLPLFAMVLFRITGIFIFAPMFGSPAVPARIKVLWGTALALCIYPLLAPALISSATASSGLFINGAGELDISLPNLVGAIASETLIGLLLGLGANLPIMGMQLAGHMVDQQIGMGLAGIINPDLEEQSSPIGQFYFLIATAIFLILGGHRTLIMTLLDSYSHIPMGGFIPGQDAILLLTGLLASMFELCVRVSAPLLCLVLLETVAMGFIARTVPQFNLMSIGFPIRILIGLGILTGAVALHAQTFADAMKNTLGTMNEFLLHR